MKRGLVTRPILCAVLIAWAGTTVSAQDPITPERIAALEAALQAERDRNDRQAERIRDLELTLVSVLDAQASEQEAVTQAQLAEAIDAAALKRDSTPRDESRRSSPLSVSGQGRFVVRAFGGDDISTDESFELEHLVLYMDLRFDDEWRARLTPGVSHRGAVFILEAYGAYAPAPWIEIQAGRFLVPFNGTHAWAFPSDSFIEPYLAENSPKPFLYSPYWDEGIMASGRVEFGAEGEHSVWYAAYVINGLNQQALDGIHKQNIGDNNNNKTVGARVSVSLRLFEEAKVTLGAAAMRGKYDTFDEHSFEAYEADLDLSWGPFSLYFEAFHRPAEFEASVAENPSALVIDVFHLTGFKLRPSVRLGGGLVLYAQADHLFQRAPTLTGGQFSVFNLDDEEFRIRTAILGLKYDWSAHFKVALEAGIFDRDRDLGDDIPFAAFSVYTYF